MPDPITLPRLVRFGTYEVDLRSGELRKNGQKIKIQEQPFHVLAMLLEHPGEIVTREELQKALWSTDTFVDFEHGLNKAINKIREALGDDADNPRFVETLARRGYRFIYPVAPVSPPAAVAALYERRLLEEKKLPAVIDRRYSRRLRTLALVAGVVVAALAALISFNVAGLRDRIIRRAAPTKSALPPLRALPFTSFPGEEDSPSFSPDGNQIAFEWNGEKEDNWDIYVKVIGTESVLRLTTNPAVDRAPAWSPDGRYIAFHRHTESEDGIYLVPALGGPERRLCSPRLGGFWRSGGLAWSPDGKYLAFVEQIPGRDAFSIFRLSVESLERSALASPTPSTPWGDSFPAFSPNGKTLAFVRDSTRMDIFLIPMAGGGASRLTQKNTYFFGHTWTPDGAHLVFSSQIGGAPGLWRVPLSGGEPEPLPVGRENAFSPALSRDGRRLAFVQGFVDTNIWRFEVPRVPGHRSLPTKLIASTKFDSSHQISPDGKRIVFASSRSGTGLTEIWLCDRDGSNPVQLTRLDAQAGTPRWSPDGRQVVFDCDAAGHFEVYRMSAEGGPPQRLTSGAGSNGVASWSRDGRWIYFASDRTGNDQVWKMPAGGGQAVQVTKTGGFAAFESQDGKTLYYAKSRGAPGLWKVPVEGGEESLVFEELAVVYWGYWAVLKDGIYFYNAETRAIKLFSFATRKITKVITPDRPPNPCCQGLSVSPDGRWILYSQIDIAASDIMLVENFRW